MNIYDVIFLFVKYSFHKYITLFGKKGTEVKGKKLVVCPLLEKVAL